MVLKSSWVDGEDVYAADMNAVATQVNTNTAAIASGVSGFATQVHAATAKTTPADADEFGSADSAASFGPKRHTWANLKAAIKAYYDSVASTLTNKTISGASNTLSGIGVGSLSATGTPSATTYLRGDNTWGTPAGGGGDTGIGPVTVSGTPTSGQVPVALTGTTASWQTLSGGGGYTPGGTDVAITDGGTGVSTLPSGLLKGAGTSPITAATAGTDYVVPGGALGTPSSATLTNATGLPVAGIVASTTSPLGVGTIELGNASDTTLSRPSAGNLAIEGNVVYRAGGTDVAVADGGTGASTLTANALLVGNGTSPVTGLSPGTSGNIATSNGTAWTSAAPPTGTLPSQTGQSGKFLTTNGTTASWNTVSGGASDGFANVVRDHGADNTGAVSSGNAFRAAIATGKTVVIPSGTYIFDGTPLASPGGNGRICIKGAGKETTHITIGSGQYLIDHSAALEFLHIEGIHTVGGTGVYRSTYASDEVAGFRVFNDCRFESFTGAAIAHRALDSPYWKLTDCQFWAGNSTSTMGVALNGLSDNSSLKGCDFIDCRVAIKLGNNPPATGGAGCSLNIDGCSFLRFGASAGNPRVDIWAIPLPSWTGTSSTGLRIVNGTRFGNENCEPTDFRILFADAAAGNFEAAWPSTSDSTGWIASPSIKDCVVQCSDTPGVPSLVFSCTPFVQGIEIGPVIQWGSSAIVPLLTFSNAASIDTDLVNSWRIGPVYDGLDQTTGRFRGLVTAVSGTLPGQPPAVLPEVYQSSLIRQDATYTLTSSTSVQKLFNGSTNGRVTLTPGVYRFVALFSLSGMSATSGNAAFSLAGTATLGAILQYTTGIDGALAAATAISGSAAATAALPAAMVTAGVGTVLTAKVEGTFEVTAGGTVIPSIQLANASAAVVAIGSYFEVELLNINTALSTIGAWS